MAPTQNENPQVVTVYGRLSFPQFTAQEAHDRSQGGQYPTKDKAEAKPNLTLLLEQAQMDKARNWVQDKFLPYCEAQHAAKEKRNALDPKECKLLSEQIHDPVLDGPYNTPFKPLSDKSKLLAPECVAALKVIGNAGTDFSLKAIVNGEKDLLIPDPDIMAYPVIRPIEQTVHEMYAGAYVGVTLNLYAYHNGKLPGFSAGGNTAVFRADADRFGGGVAVDESEIFAD